MTTLWVLDRCLRVGAAVETAGVVAVAMPTTRVTATEVIPPRVDVAVAVVDPTALLSALVPKVVSWGWLLDVGGEGAVVVARVVVMEAGTAGLEGRVAAWWVAETVAAVVAGVAVTVAADEKGASSCLVVVGGGAGFFVWPAPSLGGFAVVAVAMGLLPVGPTVIFPASPGLPVVVVTLDTGLALGSSCCEFTSSSRTPRTSSSSSRWILEASLIFAQSLSLHTRPGPSGSWVHRQSHTDKTASSYPPLTPLSLQ